MRNLRVGDIVCLRDEPMVPMKWPLAHIVEVHPGGDGKVRVITVQTMKGIYKHPIVKVVPLITNLIETVWFAKRYVSAKK